MTLTPVGVKCAEEGHLRNEYCPMKTTITVKEEDVTATHSASWCRILSRKLRPSRPNRVTLSWDQLFLSTIWIIRLLTT